MKFNSRPFTWTCCCYWYCCNPYLIVYAACDLQDLVSKGVSAPILAAVGDQKNIYRIRFSTEGCHYTYTNNWPFAVTNISVPDFGVPVPVSICTSVQRSSDASVWHLTLLQDMVCHARADFGVTWWFQVPHLDGCTYLCGCVYIQAIAVNGNRILYTRAWTEIASDCRLLQDPYTRVRKREFIVNFPQRFSTRPHDYTT